MPTLLAAEQFPAAIEPDLSSAVSDRRLQPIGFLHANNIKSMASANEHGSGKVTLPCMVTANDVREAVLYLKQRPEGVSICDVVQPIKKRIFHPPKVAAYLFWGLVTQAGERIKLSSRGWEFARSLEPEVRAYRRLIAGTGLYKTALQWFHDQGLEVINADDMVSRWQVESVGEEPEVNLARAVVSFFHLCQAAEVGTMTIGKRGQPARLRIWRGALLDYLEAHS